MDQAERLRELAKEKRAEFGLNTDPDSIESEEDKTYYHPQNVKKVIAIASGKGGVGKSNFTVNLAIELSKLGNRVMILDADLGLANVDIILGINPKYNLSHVISEQKDIKDIVTETDYGVKIIASGSGVKELVNLSNQQREKFICKISELEDLVDILLIDTGAGISKNTLSFIYASDYSIVITTPEPTALMDAYGLIKVVSLSKNNIPLKLIVNMVSSKEEAKEIASRVILLSRRFLNTFVEYYGLIFRDKNVLNSVMSQKPFTILYPTTKASDCIRDIAKKISLKILKENENIKNLYNKSEIQIFNGMFKKIIDIFKQ